MPGWCPLLLVPPAHHVVRCLPSGLFEAYGLDPFSWEPWQHQLHSCWESHPPLLPPSEADEANARSKKAHAFLDIRSTQDVALFFLSSSSVFLRHLAWKGHRLLVYLLFEEMNLQHVDSHGSHHASGVRLDPSSYLLGNTLPGA